MLWVYIYIYKGILCYEYIVSEPFFTLICWVFVVLVFHCESVLCKYIDSKVPCVCSHTQQSFLLICGSHCETAGGGNDTKLWLPTSVRAEEDAPETGGRKQY